MNVPEIQIVTDALPHDLVREVMAREAALWLGAGHDTSDDAVAALAQLVPLPWLMAVVESSRGAVARAVEARVAGGDRFARRRGFVHLVAENPTDLVRSPRSLPVYLLNGRDDATEPGSAATLPGKKALVRRLNMLEELQKARPQVLVVLADAAGKVLDEVAELWGVDGFAPRVVVIDPAGGCGPRVDAWLRHPPAPKSVTRCVLPLRDAAARLLAQAEATLPDERLLVRLIREDKTAVDVDVTECEQVEFPILDRYELLQARHLGPIAPGDLTDAQINEFFAGETDGAAEPVAGREPWAAFAAGLPWQGRSDIVELTLRGLDACLRYGADRNQFVLLPCEPGAGGTTLARVTAFAAARTGYPTLIARDQALRPNPDEIERFLGRAAARVRATTGDPEWVEAPWLLVFDVAHWRGREAEAVAFVQEITRAGRPAVVLCVVEDIAEPFHRWRKEVADAIRHDLTQDEAVTLGRHLNKFLAPRGRTVAESDWVTFWERHSPAGPGVPASFWVALSFWLRRQMDLTDTVQGWLARQYRHAAVPDGAWPLVFEIAAMSVEREGTPEAVLTPPANALAADLLAEVRKAVPALALHRTGTAADRSWYVSHDLLGRSLLNTLFYHRADLTRYGLDAARDPIHLRIMLLRRVATRPALTRKAHRALALEFPVNIFKLDDGRLEFAPYWGEVLDALDAMPAAFRENSRTYKHHAAISRRRVAAIKEYFNLTPEQRRQRLDEAVTLLEEALALPPDGDDDESDLNLYNSLSLGYQNLADAERELGADPARLTILWKRATEAAQQAKRLNPRNSYVLETLARNLILTAKLYPDQAAERVAEALGYVYQAMTLEKAIERQRSLLKYAQEAVDILRTPAGIGQAARLAAAGNPFGHLALAWVHLSGTNPKEVLTIGTFRTFPPARLRLALNQLAAVAEPNPLVLQLRYELTVAIDRWAFADHLAVLDALELNIPRMPLQLRLERAILLHQVNRHKEANELYAAVRRVARQPANQEFIVVPEHLEWLAVRQAGTDRLVKRVCDGRAIGRKDEYKNWAKVAQLQNTDAPYNPREFAGALSPGQAFKCYLSFGHNGPLIKPVVGGEELA